MLLGLISPNSNNTTINENNQQFSIESAQPTSSIVNDTGGEIGNNPPKK